MNKTSINVFNLLESELSLVDRAMRQEYQDTHPDIEAALNHLLDAGGKRVRPTLLILFGKMFDAPLDRSTTMAAAIELLHNATLVHDDFIDGSLLRRGIPTLNAQWSSGATVLTGDYIFAKAAHLASISGSIEHMQLFSKALMTIVVGEVSQLFSVNGQTLESMYYDRIYAKTAALFTLACEVGALLGNASEETVSAVRAYGTAVGCAFQIIDDMLDFSSAADTLGKPVGGDLQRGIITLPAIYYFADFPNQAGVNDILNHKNIPGQTMLDLIEAIRSSDAIERTHARAREFISEGIQALSEFPSGLEKDALIDLAYFVTDRTA
ncbi:MAG: polyprenyl synthetase family protein [Anaerolineales bacterium]|nr:polyprenyl synthetase family protein [Anaerolineales bacterium]